MLKAIIFDMDGVIADTEPIYHIVTDDLLREHGIITADDYQDQFIGVTSEFMWTTIVNEFHLPLTPEECIRIIDKKRAEIEKTDGLHPLPNVIDLIKRLYDHGYPLAVASSSPVSEINRVTEHFGIQPYFRVFFSGEDCLHSKPDPEVFLKAADALQIQPDECLVIEDSKNGLIAAKRAGMKSIGFANPMFGNQDLSSATAIVSSFKDVTIDLCQKLF
ncbi:MAG TPA: HAD family phosphatase [Candidatus Fimousia stercorigallinarum]|nr:HAD family phosphatase [Candidatus Fimousia stercorigallinarum]